MTPAKVIYPICLCTFYHDIIGGERNKAVLENNQNN